ncbi:hypothetical protein [Microbaculum marinum]|uniref:Uncharacterized protein n=1 Tax=Microbaculum marinum TaxID=1764581 RepID=A0AAW9RAR7_9HYPH
MIPPTMPTEDFRTAPDPVALASGRSVHDAACSIWDVPEESSAEALVAAAHGTEERAVYLSEMRPLYDAAKRCLTQLSGFLLLLQTSRLDPGREGLLLASAIDQLKACGERLDAVAAPAGARRHHAAMKGLLARLNAIAAVLDRAGDLIDPAGAALDEAMNDLFAAQRRLLALSAPDAGLTPMDFSAACCNCRPKNRQASGQ